MFGIGSVGKAEGEAKEKVLVLLRFTHKALLLRRAVLPGPVRRVFASTEHLSTSVSLQHAVAAPHKKGSIGLPAERARDILLSQVQQETSMKRSSFIALGLLAAGFRVSGCANMPGMGRRVGQLDRWRQPGWRTGTASATPTGGPKAALSWPTRGQAGSSSRRSRTGISRSMPSSGPKPTPTAASSCALPIPAKVGADTSYEVNILDSAPTRVYATGAIVDVATVSVPTPKAGGRWNTLRLPRRARS